MKLGPTIAIAYTALARNKTRSLLTVLRVVIGVGAVIAMVSIGEGAKIRVAQAFEGMGTATLFVRSGSIRTRGVRGGAGSEATLTWDAKVLAGRDPGRRGHASGGESGRGRDH